MKTVIIQAMREIEECREARNMDYDHVAGEIEKALLAAGYEKRDTIERVINPFKSPVNEKMANDVAPDTTKETEAIAV